MNSVYFDNASTTPMREEVVQAIFETMKSDFGNPSSSHSFGRSAKALIEKSRKAIAKFLNVSAAEIIFTSGGTEADNLVLKSCVKDLKVMHIITSRIEHHAVLHTIQQLKIDYSILVSYVDVNANGTINYEHLEQLLIKSDDKTLVSLMHINNEIGTVLDLKQTADLCKINGALFHTDAVQSVGHYKLDLQNIQVDFLAASAHKFHGPKGVGFAFVKKNSGLRATIIGGEQERGLRAGTESVHNIVGIEKALELADTYLEADMLHIKNLKQYFIDEIKTTIPGVRFNGSSDDFILSSYTIVNVCLPILPEKSAMLLFQLDLKGIACSRGSACQSGSSKKSHVLSEILSKEALEKPSIRFSFSKYNTKAEVDYVVGVLKMFI